MFSQKNDDVMTCSQKMTTGIKKFYLALNHVLSLFHPRYILVI